MADRRVKAGHAMLRLAHRAAPGSLDAQSGPGGGGNRHPSVRLASLVVLGALSILSSACGSSTSQAPNSNGGPTIASSCASFGSTADSSGRSSVTRTPAVAYLRNVQVQASSCTDEVSFLFSGGLPGWSVGYQSGALVADPSGKPVTVAGADHLVLRFEPAAGVDLTGANPHATYDGPTALRPPRPSGVAEVRELGDFESVMTWAIGLSSRESFEVVRRPDQLVVRISARGPRVTRCELTSAPLTAGYPPSWYTELGDRWVCRYFNRSPFAIHPSTDAMPWAVSVQRSHLPARETVSEFTAQAATVHSSSATIAGYPATVLDLTDSGKALYPAGYVFRVYVIDLQGDALLVQSTPGPPGAATDQRRSDAQRIAELLRRS